MKRILFLSILSLLIIACAKDDSVVADTDAKVDFRDVQEKVDVCHLTGSGDYHTITINANALDAHLAHGDYEGECTDCDPASCIFCDANYLDYLDFDETCDEIPHPYFADYYCKGEINEGVTEGCEGEDFRGWAVLVDSDLGYCYPDPDGEDDHGELWAYYRKDGCGNWFGLVSFFYWDNNDPENDFDHSFHGFTQDAYEQAYYCATVIAGINAALATPLVNQNNECLIYDDNIWAMTAKEGKDQFKSSKENRELFYPQIDYPAEINKSLEDLRSKHMKEK